MDKNLIILTADRVLTGPSLQEEEKACILVQDSKIKEVFPIDRLDSYGQIPVADLGHSTLMPGMIECHNHVCLDARRKGYLQRMNLSACELTLDALKNLEDDLMSGVTTARSCGDRFYIDCVMRDKIRAGEVTGPEIIASGIGMRSMHGHGYVGLPHTGREEFLRRSRENLARSVDMLKIYITGGAPPKSGSHIPCYLSEEEVRTVAGEAANLGIPTAVHCIGGEGLRRCVLNGIDVIEHAYCISEEDLELVIREDKWIDITSGVFLDEAREPFYDEAFLDSVRKNRESISRNMEMLFKSGVKYAIGTDAFHGNLYRELMLAVSLGASNREALMAVGYNAARMCGRENSIGAISEGMNADIIAVGGNPLEDISCMKNVSFVMKQGVVYKN